MLQGVYYGISARVVEREDDQNVIDRTMEVGRREETEVIGQESRLIRGPADDEGDVDHED